MNVNKYFFFNNYYFRIKTKVKCYLLIKHEDRNNRKRNSNFTCQDTSQEPRSRWSCLILGHEFGSSGPLWFHLIGSGTFQNTHTLPGFKSWRFLSKRMLCMKPEIFSMQTSLFFHRVKTTPPPAWSLDAWMAGKRKQRRNDRAKQLTYIRCTVPVSN